MAFSRKDGDGGGTAVAEGRTIWPVGLDQETSLVVSTLLLGKVSFSLRVSELCSFNFG